MIAVLTAFLLSSPAGFEWPDPARNPIVLVNANQAIATYVRNHAAWFTPGEMVLDLSVQSSGDAAGGEQVRRETVELLRSKGLTAGTYTSGTTAEPLAAIQVWPYDKTPFEWLGPRQRWAGTWPGEPRRLVIDVRDARTRHALAAGIRRIWSGSPAPLRFVDNAASHPSTGGTQPWAAYCTNIREIREMAGEMGSRAVFNVAVHPSALSDTEARQLITAVGAGGGILLEDPWGPATRRDPALTARARRRYRELLDHGIAVIVLPMNVPFDELQAWIRSWRKPDDRLYMGWSFWREPWDGKPAWGSQ